MENPIFYALHYNVYKTQKLTLNIRIKTSCYKCVSFSREQVLLVLQEFWRKYDVIVNSIKYWCRTFKCCCVSYNFSIHFRLICLKNKTSYTSWKKNELDVVRLYNSFGNRKINNYCSKLKFVFCILSRPNAMDYYYRDTK